ncbi:hypothetical protein DSUL_30010 [Desulfovibrionales bacterium]
MTTKKNKSDTSTTHHQILVGPTRPNISPKVALAATAVALMVIFLTAFLHRLEPIHIQLQHTQTNSAHDQASHPITDMLKNMPSAMTTINQMNSDNVSIQAIADLMYRIRINPQDLQAQKELGEKFLEVGNFQAAQYFLTKALVAWPSDIHLLGLLGMCMAGNKKFPEAAAYYEQITTLDPDNPQAWFNLGILYRDYLGRTDDARDIFKKILALKITSPVLQNEVYKELAAKPMVSPIPQKKPEQAKTIKNPQAEKPDKS